MKLITFLLRLLVAAAVAAFILGLVIAAGVLWYRSPAGAAADEWGPRIYIGATAVLMLIFVVLARRQKFGRMLGGLVRRRPRDEAPGAPAADDTRAQTPRRIAAYRERRGIGANRERRGIGEVLRRRP